ncbi:Uma2 family endonuclease [Salicibibacter cibarius]|uniref:Uma2 family endonuclease n=1 Tax=Salicibibacter cibarius TaxID=2743000 RepID=UPI001FE9C83C|nr:Uma2 family endonuclease [Salicibibacter cibarius]
MSVICDFASLTEKGFKGPPSLVAEALSPSTAMKDFNEKFNVYEQAGVEEY